MKKKIRNVNLYYQCITCEHFHRYLSKNDWSLQSISECTDEKVLKDLTKLMIFKINKVQLCHVLAQSYNWSLQIVDIWL